MGAAARGRAVDTRHTRGGQQLELVSKVALEVAAWVSNDDAVQDHAALEPRGVAGAIVHLAAMTHRRAICFLADCRMEQFGIVEQLRERHRCHRHM